MGRRVAAERTPIGSRALASLLSTAWVERHGEPIRSDVLALLLALADLETGDGVPGRFVLPNAFHNNYGNIIIAAPNLASSASDHFVLQGDEGADAGAGDAEHHYRVYASPQDGAMGLLSQLTRQSRQQWWDGLLTGDPESFVRALNGQNGGPSYFEAGFDRYLRTFLTRWRKYSENAVAEPEGPTLPKAQPRKGRILLPIALGGALFVFISRRSSRAPRV